jgi:uncharacterized protein YdhG (YjbR/CyaY superfamily)
MGSRATSVSQYLQGLDPERRQALSELRNWVRLVLPDARETLLYRMPTYELGRPVCAIAAQKHHLALYVCEAPALERHRACFSHLSLGKGCIRFRRFSDLPRDAVRRLLRDAEREGAAQG